MWDPFCVFPTRTSFAKPDKNGRVGEFFTTKMTELRTVNSIVSGEHFTFYLTLGQKMLIGL